MPPKLAELIELLGLLPGRAERIELLIDVADRFRDVPPEEQHQRPARARRRGELHRDERPGTPQVLLADRDERDRDRRRSRSHSAQSKSLPENALSIRQRLALRIRDLERLT